MNGATQDGLPRGHAPVATRQDDAAQYLTFMLGGEMFGIGILAIREIIEYAGVTEVPMMPPVVRGVINLRGAVVPVVDLQSRFGRAPTEIGRRTCIVILETRHAGERHVVGVVVDAVSAVLDIPASEIEPPPTFGTRIRSDFIQGMGKLQGRFIILLDVSQVLSLDELGAFETSAAGQELSPIA
ncbi:chemotaxis protein CheW [Pararobbsia silviterrae]|uniref:Purine-binding chemotaxis protein CheW n=1 Tax=Pararobbsia silviterrae TaxID=1792498 RepID=A0A494Y3J6_9BURK|nr:chemotaxis protein CheW [Pararobbsia silviterrae]RKP56588.1 purine-binding chemotaxis protein CheW [Pararobbsia silviterrae]